MSFSTNALPELSFGTRETQTRPSYFWENNRREPSEMMVIQRTIAGEIFFRERATEARVMSGHAVLFTHQENSCYGFPEDASGPYRCEYVLIKPGAGLRELFNSLRAQFGSVVKMSDGGEAATWMRDMIEEIRIEQGDRFRNAEACFRLLLAIFKEQQLAIEAEDPLVTVKRRIETDFRHPIQIKQLADEVGISREHLIRKFKARHGATPGEYLMQLRMGHARELKQTTQLGSASISRQCGYFNEASFRRAYRNAFPDA